MSGAHQHKHDSSYYLEQLWTIGTCGALGIVMVLLWYYRVLAIFLDKKFHDPVLWGGLALLALVGVRAVDLWIASRRLKAVMPVANSNQEPTSHEDHENCEHDHHHHEDHHDHEHEKAGNGHEYEHEHGWAPWRYAVLLVPTVLFLMKIPWPEPPDAPEEPGVLAAKLDEVERAADLPGTRADWTDKTVAVKGKIQDLWNNPRFFGFVRLKMTCCYADAYGEPVKMMVETPTKIDYDRAREKGGWVKVIGKLEFRKAAKMDLYIPVIQAQRVTPVNTPSNQFDN
jgi:hypothetical protein